MNGCSVSPIGRVAEGTESLSVAALHTVMSLWTVELHLYGQDEPSPGCVFNRGNLNL